MERFSLKKRPDKEDVQDNPAPLPAEIAPVAPSVTGAEEWPRLIVSNPESVERPIIVIAVVISFAFAAAVVFGLMLKRQIKRDINSAFDAANLPKYVFASYCLTREDLLTGLLKPSASQFLDPPVDSPTDGYVGFVNLGMNELHASNTFTLTNSPAFSITYTGLNTVSTIFLFSILSSRVGIIDDVVEIVVERTRGGTGGVLERSLVAAVMSNTVGIINNSACLDLMFGDVITPKIRRKFPSLSGDVLEIKIENFNVIVSEFPSTQT